METKNLPFKSSWISPSNIALVKYWGKLPVQVPANPSVSFTLKNSVTKMDIEAWAKTETNLSLDFYFEGSLNEKFKEKILKFLEGQKLKFPWLLKFHLIIRSENTFPHSSGIASSASSMSALNLCLMSLNEKITGKKLSHDDFYREVSELSRLASGSAGRSVYPFMASWGEKSASFASAVDKKYVHPVFHHYCDSIIIVDAGEKSVSSRAGHSLMDSHPFKEERYKRASNNLRRLMEALKQGSLDTFIEVVEEEALMLHALMMTSSPSYILLRPESLLLIEKIREFRKATQIPVCFTIDAGPNIHLLYPLEVKEQVSTWLENNFSHFRIIHDEVGSGPERIGE